MTSKFPRQGCRNVLALKSILSTAIAVAILSSASQADTVETLAYSFEDDLQGFSPNSAFITMAQDTIGATEGAHSMRVDIESQATFEGALTSVIDPEILGDPPGVNYIVFDLTIPAEFPTPPTAGFGVVGVTMFGHMGPIFGHSAQFADEEHLDGKAAGTYRDVRIDLNLSRGPFGAGKSFNQIFGTEPTDLTLSGFQLFFNKTGSPSNHPLTVYIDNIRTGRIDPVPGDYNVNGVVDAGDYVLWRNGGPLQNEGEGITPGQVTIEDYEFWRSRFGAVSGLGSGDAFTSVPEPAAAVLLLVAAVCGWGTIRERN
jgi:hypothetical protein